MNILHVDSSILGDDSVSRKLSAASVERLVAIAEDARVTYRDVGSHPVPQFSPALVKLSSGASTQANDVALRDEAATLNQVLEEVLEADVIVIGAPMYNFSVPSQLKSWLDAIAIAGKTFRYGAGGVEGLLGDKRVIIASARGGFYQPGTPAAAAEHHESYLLGFLGFLGISRIEIVRAEGVRISPEQAESSLAGALQQAGQLKAA